MTPPTVERLVPALLGVLGAHPLKRQLRLLHAQALQRFSPEEVCGGRSLLIFRRGLDAMDEAPGFSDDGGASHKIAHQATYRQTIRDCPWGSSVEETASRRHPTRSK